LDLHSTAELKRRIQDGEFSLVFHESSESSLTEIFNSAAPKEVILVIGPEGGITEDEVAGLVTSGAKVVSIGRAVFRSAHAGVAALAAVQTGFGIW
jgi:16S rRNA (uracil1498-N3)-methyltransferase